MMRIEGAERWLGTRPIVQSMRRTGPRTESQRETFVDATSRAAVVGQMLPDAVPTVSGYVQPKTAISW